MINCLYIVMFVVLTCRYGPGSGHIWLDEVNCGGNEYFIQDCQRDDFGENDCAHLEDVGVICHRE